MSNNLNIAIIGAGPIAREYVKVLLALGNVPFVIGRGQKNVDKIKSHFPAVNVIAGGLEEWLKSNKPPSYAIIATPIQYLATATKQLLEAGTRNILVEKPLTYSLEEAQSLADLVRSLSADVTIAFNRRSYVSVNEAVRLIQKDGGVSSFHFDFTEATFRINPENYDMNTNQYWGIANSSHVIDTAFFLGGKPKWMECRQYGNAVSWHHVGSIFTGIGETIDGVPFTYHANWGCPGKWNIEIMTPERKLLFSPMERLHQQVKGSFDVELAKLDYSVDTDYKPGFFQQVEAWLESTDYLMDIESFIHELAIYQKIFSY